MIEPRVTLSSKERKNFVIRIIRKILGKLNLVFILIFLAIIFCTTFLIPYFLYTNPPPGIKYNSILEGIEKESTNSFGSFSISDESLIVNKKPLDDNFNFLTLRNSVTNELLGAYTLFLNEENLGKLNLQESFVIKQTLKKSSKPFSPNKTTNGVDIEREVLGSLESFLKSKNFQEEYSKKYKGTHLSFESLTEYQVKSLTPVYREFNFLAKVLFLLILLNSLVLLLINVIINNLETRRRKLLQKVNKASRKGKNPNQNVYKRRKL